MGKIDPQGTIKEIGPKKPSVSAQNNSVSDHKSYVWSLIGGYMIAHKEYSCEYLWFLCGIIAGYREHRFPEHDQRNWTKNPL